jgi:tetratricopeptide (TPR) repeat protein
MDEANRNELDLLVNTEGTCPHCGKTATLVEYLLAARQAAVSDTAIACCPQCGHLFRHELQQGRMTFGEDLTESLLNDQTSPEADTPAEQPDVRLPEENENVPELISISEDPGEIPEPQAPENPAPQTASQSSDEDEQVQEIIEEFKVSPDAEEKEEPVEEEMRTCPKCGRSIPARANFCPYCRKALRENRTLNGLKKYRLPAAIALAVIVIAAALIIYLPNASKRRSYNLAISLARDGDYQQAVQLFSELGDYQKAARYVQYCQGILAFQEGSYEDAASALKAAGKLEEANRYLAYLDGLEKLAANSLKNSDYQSAAEDFEKAGQISDAAAMAAYSKALGAFVSDEPDEAVRMLNDIISSNSVASQFLSQARQIIGYLSAVERLESGDEKALDDLADVLKNSSGLISRKAGDLGDYIEAISYYREKKFYTAMTIFNSISDFRDSQKMADSCRQSRPSSGIVYRSGSSGAVSLTIYDSSDGDDMFVKIYNASDTLVETLYIRDGSKATAKLPAGSFRVALAVGKGDEWYGPVETFGPSGTYQRLLLTGSEEYYKFKAGKYTLKFNVSNGNVNHTYTDYGDV